MQFVLNDFALKQSLLIRKFSVSCPCYYLHEKIKKILELHMDAVLLFVTFQITVNVFNQNVWFVWIFKCLANLLPLISWIRKTYYAIRSFKCFADLCAFSVMSNRLNVIRIDSICTSFKWADDNRKNIASKWSFLSLASREISSRA